MLSAKPPYNFAFNNPISFIDPDGRAPFWIQQVNDDGSTSLIAEAGDSAATLQEQFGLKDGQAEKITGTTGNTGIAEGSTISGEQVKNATGSEVLELVLGKATPQDVLNQFAFAADYSNLNGNGLIDTKEFFSNIFLGSTSKWTGTGGQSGRASLDVGGGEQIEVGFDLRIDAGTSEFNSERANIISATPSSARQRPDSSMEGRFLNFGSVNPRFVPNGASIISTKNANDYSKLSKRFNKFRQN